MAEKEEDIPEVSVEKTGPDDCIWEGLLEEEKHIRCIKPINIVSLIFSICGGVMIFLCTTYGLCDGHYEDITYWIKITGPEGMDTSFTGNGVFGLDIWITGAVALISGGLAYTKTVSRSKFYAFLTIVMCIISLGLNYYEIVLFSGSPGWEYGMWFNLRKREEGPFGEDYYDKTTINNVVGLIFYLGIFRAIVTVITTVLIIYQSISMYNLEKKGILKL